MASIKDIPGRHVSLWLDTTPTTAYPALDGLHDTDVLVIGGGIVGISVVDGLVHLGQKATLIDSGKILSGVTGFTTGKITSLHTLIYDRLIRRFGFETAKLYGDANQWAVTHIRQRVQDNRIECDFTEDQAYTYAMSTEYLKQIEDEVEAAKSLGLPASFEFVANQRFPIAGAIRFTDQARFHPRKYLFHVAEEAVKRGITIFENTRATEVRENHGHFEVLTENGVVRCKKLVLACHAPFYDESYFFMRLFPRRSYAVAMRCKGPLPDGMFINIDEPVRSMRRHRLDDQDILILGGEGHKVGQEQDSVERYLALTEWAKKHFEVDEFLYYWSTQDNETADGLPYIGLASQKSDSVYIACGFDGWGMTNGTVAGRLISDMIAGVRNPWQSLFDPNRGEMKGMGKVLKEGVDVAIHYFGDKLKDGELVDLNSMSPGEGKLVETTNGAIGAYRDHEGRLHTISPKCTHMGCNLHWNSAEQSWDCPCHGSRFSPEGTVLHGPAVLALERISLSDIEQEEPPN